MNIVQQTFNNHIFDLVEKDNDLWFTGEQIGIALEYKNPRDAILDIYSRNKDELDEYSVTLKLRATDGKKYKTRVFNEKGVMLITMFSRQRKAKIFRRWAVDILNAYRHGELVAMSPKAQHMMMVDKVFNASKRIARNAGLKGDDAILKAAERTQKSIGVDVFEYLGYPKPVTRQLDLGDMFQKIFGDSDLSTRP